MQNPFAPPSDEGPLGSMLSGPASALVSVGASAIGVAIAFYTGPSMLAGPLAIIVGAWSLFVARHHRVDNSRTRSGSVVATTGSVALIVGCVSFVAALGG